MTSSFLTLALFVFSLIWFKTETQRFPKPMFLKRRLCVTEKGLTEHSCSWALFAASLSLRHPPPGLIWKGRVQLHRCILLVKPGLKLAWKVQESPCQSLWAGGTTAHLFNAFAPSLFEREEGKKTFKSSEPFLIFQFCEKGCYPLGTRLSSRAVLSGGAVLQRHILTGGTLWQISFTDMSTHGYCSLFYLGDNGWKKQFPPVRPPLLSHRQTAPAGTEMTLNLHRGTWVKLKRRMEVFLLDLHFSFPTLV